jgi:3'-phosphoadenosine 5'-phosphosulfate sulfotransferase (PAPS reductase)/FAD synthetase
MKHTREELKQWQSLPLGIKINMTIERIRNWINEFGTEGVYVSFSGGKDSTVLLDIVRNRMGYTEIPAVYVDTGLEYPEIRDFVKTFDNVVWLKPKMNFRKVIETYGYPFISKEVSESVYYARKYLHIIENSEMIARQTDRQQADNRRSWICRPTRNRTERQGQQGTISKLNDGDYP